MILFCTFGFAFLLILIALMNVLWFFLLPEKGENHPTIQSILEVERTIKRVQDPEDANWDILRRRVKNLKVQMSLIQSSKSISYFDLQTLNLILESLLSYVEGNWRLYDMGEEPQVAWNFYSKSLSRLENANDRNLVFNILIDSQNNISREVDLSSSVQNLYGLVSRQCNSLSNSQAA
ncbi:MAG: hypothetical protein SFU25_00230 [Candidatus Caenarcaniphilales bacterium]|nr:hypothetical protein [Candidatus Caenarcaniphilales bacterium]